MHPLRIGSVPLDGHVIMAPMAGVGGPVFRRVAREHGASMVVTPLISAEGIVRGDPASRATAAVDPTEEPCAIQIFGHDPGVMARAARQVEGMGARLIDINAGCPSKRIVSNRAGAYLMRDPGHLLTIIASVVDSVSVPVTMKTRLGWSAQEVLVIPVIHAATRAGAAAIAIHARFKGDGPAAPARWEWIRAAVEETEIPVIGNGGIRVPGDAGAMVAATGCAGVMVGRAAVGRPWLLRQCEQTLAGEAPDPEPPFAQRLGAALRHVLLQQERDAGEREVRATAGIISAYLRGMHQARRLRSVIVAAKSYADLSYALHNEIPGIMGESQFVEEES